MSAENTATTARKVYLETFNDWRTWDKAFQLRANAASIWGLVDPDTDEQPMPPPARPQVSSYFRRIPPQRIEPEQPRPTRRSEGQGSSQTLMPTYMPEITDPMQRAQVITDLTAEDKASYQSSRKDYDQDYREYKEQRDQVNILKKWMMDTVAIGLMDSAFDPQQDLRSWYISLRDSVGATQTQQRNEARTKYQTILAAVPKAARDFPRWLTDWEQATHQAQAQGIGGLEDPNVWFSDLCKAIRPAVGSWVSTYRGIYRKELESRSLSIREIAKALREEFSEQGLQQPARNTTARVKRGAFGPTFGTHPDPADLPDQENDPDQEDRKPAGSSGSPGPSRPKRNPRKRQSEQPAEQPAKKTKESRDQGNSSPSCDACGGAHRLATCYYIFPSQAPSSFKGNPLVRDAIAYRLQSQGLKDKIKALKGSAGPAESD